MTNNTYQSENGQYAFGDGRRRQEALLAQSLNAPPTLSSGIPALDASIGGGFARGELTLSICAHEELNTMLAVQMAAGLAMRGVPGLIFTTIDTKAELADKLARRASNLPVFRDNYYFDPRVPPDAIRTTIQRYVGIVDWRDQNATSHAAFQHVLREANAFFGAAPQYLLLNRFGPDFWHRERVSFNAPWAKYHDVATTLRTVAQSYNMAVIAFAEGNQGKCHARQRIEATFAQECPRIGQIAQTVIGVSSLPDNRGVECEVYSPTQFITAAQYRPGSQGGVLPVKVCRKMGEIVAAPAGYSETHRGVGRW